MRILFLVGLLLIIFSIVSTMDFQGSPIKGECYRSMTWNGKTKTWEKKGWVCWNE